MAGSESPGSPTSPMGRMAVALLGVLRALAVVRTSWERPEQREPVVVQRPSSVATTPHYRNVEPGVAYVGDAICARCHREIAESFGSHPMGRSMAPAAEVMP